jgi:hypothetical protein
VETGKEKNEKYTNPLDQVAPMGLLFEGMKLLNTGRRVTEDRLHEKSGDEGMREERKNFVNSVLGEIC